MKATQNKICLLAILLLSTMANAQENNNSNKNTKNKELIMTTAQKNEAIIRNLYEQVLNKRNLQQLQDIVSDDYVGVRGQKGAAGFQATIADLIKGFPDIQWHVEELVGEGDKVVIKWTVQGTHTGQFQQYPATGKTVSSGGIGIYELKNGKITGTQVQTDRLGFLQQLGVLPVDLSSLSIHRHHENQVSFIDKFFIPAAAKAAFLERMKINRSLIKTLPGFVEDAAYEYTDSNGNLICITVARWESKEALDKAKEAVQAEYKKQGFDMAEMLRKTGITVDRGIYTNLEAQ